jgi:hypothetical protein
LKFSKETGLFAFVPKFAAKKLRKNECFGNLTIILESLKINHSSFKKCGFFVGEECKKFINENTFQQIMNILVDDELVIFHI